MSGSLSSDTDPTGRGAFACGRGLSLARSAQDVFDLSEALDRARDMHLETVRLRLTRIRDNGEALAVSDMVHIVREAFAAGVSSLADAQTAQATARQLAELELEEAMARAAQRRESARVARRAEDEELPNVLRFSGVWVMGHESGREGA